MFDFSSIKNRMQGTQLLEHGVFFSANPVAGINVFIKMLTEAERKRLAQIFFEKKIDRLEISLHLLQSREVIDLINCT
jgi:hypothetical protein